MKIHIVQKGDTLWEIAKKYNVDFEQLKSMNSHLSDPNLLMPGMKIKVPTGNIPVKKQKKEKPFVKEKPYVKEAPKQHTPMPPPMPKEKPYEPEEDHFQPVLESEIPLPTLPQGGYQPVMPSYHLAPMPCGCHPMPCGCRPRPCGCRPRPCGCHSMHHHYMHPHHPGMQHHMQPYHPGIQHHMHPHHPGMQQQMHAPWDDPANEMNYGGYPMAHESAQDAEEYEMNHPHSYGQMPMHHAPHMPMNQSPYEMPMHHSPYQMPMSMMPYDPNQAHTPSLHQRDAYETQYESPPYERETEDEDTNENE